MSETAQILQRAQNVLIGNYARLPVVMARGEGSLVWDTDGKEYIDLFAGFGGAILGHCHPALIAAATQQAAKLWHVGNVFHTEPQVELAERLNKVAFAGKAFFCHSGLEANEAACKLARLRGHEAHKWKIISLNHSFHGRSMAMIAATGNPAVKAGFEPVVPGFVQVEPGNLSALEATVDGETCGIIMETIQGEGGIHVQSAEYLAAVRALCDQRGLTLIFDEVWTGCGRTGRWFGYQHSNVEPDIMTLGKAIGGGLPVGAMWAKPALADLMVPGKHGCTLGGNPICMAVSKTIFDVIEAEHLTERAASLGEKGIGRLGKEGKLKEKIAEIRGRGLMLGIELRQNPAKIVEKGLQRGVIINLTAGKVIRLAPPINIPSDLWERGLDLLVETLAS
ncbi:MAG TPA: acetylornithine/succinylornithine family transaminase [Tepidisphaeraceae bacterium]|nr:acetylornithine/succinylornithine family transaminase [Tepidisphaeraceae bacterium]